jgi:hypothetical protein
MRFDDLVKKQAKDFDGLVAKHREISGFHMGPFAPSPHEEDIGSAYPWKKTGEARHDKLMPIAVEALRSLLRLNIEAEIIENAPTSDPSQHEFPELMGVRRAMIRLEFQTYGLPQPESWPMTGRHACILVVAPPADSKAYIYASKVTRPFKPPYVLMSEIDMANFDKDKASAALLDAIDKTLCYAI